MASKLSLYIATSLDGYIARPDGAIDWLVKYENGSTDCGYGEFYASVDAMLMGRKTYETVAGFGGPWPHADRPCYVLSRSSKSFPHAEAISGDMKTVIARLQAKHKKIWLVGGAELVGQAIASKCLDELIITFIPVLLGSGIRLFEDSPAGAADLSHAETRVYAGGLTQVKYALNY